MHNTFLNTPDYFPFGLRMYNRSSNSSNYRYGFQGQEMDDEIKGEGNSINYKYRMYDPRIGRFFAVDPLTAKYPHYTPYSFSGNKVINAVELEGLEEEVIYVYNPGKEDAKLIRVNWEDVPANSDDAHGPLGTGTLVYQMELVDGEYSTNGTYIQSFGDLVRNTGELLNGTHDEGKKRRATKFEQWALDNVDQSQVESLIKDYFPKLPSSKGKGKGNTVTDGVETGNGYNNPYVPKESDSAKVYIWRAPTKDQPRGGNEIKIIAKKDTVGQKVNGKNYGEEYENAPILDIK